MDLRFEQFQNLRPEGSPDAISETGPADCVGRAEALELAGSPVPV